MTFAGTGKTVIAALDYKRFLKEHARESCRFLFIAHREEILKQSLYTFRAVLKDANFGDLFVGSYKPDSLDALFISIQTFNSRDFTEKVSRDFYDYIVVDEFHHAAVATYQRLLSYFQPKILLGLTATPERMDGKNILVHFDNRIAAEIRLPEAIDRKLLSPFQYFGVTDTVDLDSLKWSAGGYDKSELTNLYTFSGKVAEKRADMIIASLLRYVTDINTVIGLGFCVSVQHAEFMSRFFNERGIPSINLTGNSTDEERRTANNRLVSGEIRFISVPKGCYIQLERKAEKYILDNIRASYGNSAGLIMRIASFEEDSGQSLSLAAFLKYNHLDPRSLYKFSSFSRLCVRADIKEDFKEELEETLTKALLRLSVVDSRRWIEFLLRILPRIKDVDFAQFSPIEKRMLQMFYVTIWGNPIEVWNGDEILNRMYALSDSPVMLQEMIDLLKYQYEQIDFIDEPVDVGFDCPLDLHCTYTRDQLLVALDFMKPSTVREGVKWLPDQKLDVFFVTLNKADKDYSPTTMYQDYSINEYLFHWQSQSTTSEQSPTAQRYIHHKQMGSRVLLFVREFKKDRLSGGAEAYTFLGTADYVEHEGEKPMNITWRLNAPIPAKYIKKTGKLLVG